MGEGSFRNRQCWCGSGKKYKRCHLARDKQVPPNPYELGNQVRKAFSAKYCLAPEALKPECSGKIIAAHTVHRSSQEAIAREGHVYAFVPSMDDLIKHEGVLPPKLTGIGVTSTFNGFCARHDNDLFRPVETERFHATQEQCFLLAYRALTREIFTKKAQLKTVQVQRNADAGRSAIDQVMIQAITSGMEAGVDAALADQAHLKSLYDACIVKREFSEVRAYAITFDAPPPVMCSGMFAPEYDLISEQLQDLGDTSNVPHYLSISSFFDGEHGEVVFAWLQRDDTTCRHFADQIDAVRDDVLASVLTRIFFEYIENLAIQPDWWERLDDGYREALVRRMAYSANPMNERKADSLMDDGVCIPGWGATVRCWIP